MILANPKNATHAPISRFPRAPIEKLLRHELDQCAEGAQILTGDWEPSIDSMDLVSVVVGIEKILGCKIKPEDVIRRGGYRSKEEGFSDMLTKIESRWHEHIGSN